jgi:hypothetical protein
MVLKQDFVFFISDFAMGKRRRLGKPSVPLVDPASNEAAATATTATKVLFDCFNTLPDAEAELTNGHVLFAFYQAGKNGMQTAKNLQAAGFCTGVDITSLSLKINKMQKEDASHRKKIILDKYQNFCLAKWDTSKLKKMLVTTTAPPSDDSSTLHSIPHADLTDLSHPSASVSFVTPVRQTPSESPLKTRSVSRCSNCRKKNLDVRLCLKSKQEACRKQAKVMSELKETFKPQWQLKATIARRDSTISKQKSLIKSLKKEIEKLKKKIAVLSNHLEVTRLKLKAEQSSAKKAAKKQENNHEKVRRELELHNDNILCQLEEAQSAQKENCPVNELHKSGRAHSDLMRLIVYSCLQGNTPVGEVPGLIRRITSLLSIELSKMDIPNHESTVATWALELGVWSDCQVAEFLYTQQKICLAFDATTQDGVHVNAVHVTYKEKCYVLGLDQLPGGTAVDYATHIISTLQRFAKLYSSFNAVDYDHVLKQMLSNITCVMTDRAIVNQAAIRIIEEECEISLSHVNCNLHPIDSITSKCKTEVQAYEKVNKVSCPQLFSGACLNEKFVLGMNTLRFKDGSGSPSDVKAVLDEHKLPRGLISRYRGNRLHILFHLSFVYFSHIDVFSELLSHADTTLKSALKQCLAIPLTIAELHAFSLFGKLVTSPWMSKFYSNTSGLSFVDCIDVVRNVVSRIENVTPHLAVNYVFPSDMFGNPIDMNSNPRLWAIESQDVIDLQIVMLKGAVTVLKKQYGTLFDLSTLQLIELGEQSAGARIHNIDAEEIVGMFSAAQTKAPNATIPYISSRIRAKKNLTLQTLIENRPSSASFEKVIHAAGRIRRTRKAEKDRLVQELRKRISQKRQMREEASRRKLQRTLESLRVDGSIDRGAIEQSLPEYCDEVDTIVLLLSGEATGEAIVHNWAEGDQFMIVPYCGKVGAFTTKGRKKPKAGYKVMYWKEGEDPDNAEECFMLANELVCDYLLGDLVFS